MLLSIYFRYQVTIIFHLYLHQIFVIDGIFLGCSLQSQAAAVGHCCNFMWLLHLVRPWTSHIYKDTHEYWNQCLITLTHSQACTCSWLTAGFALSLLISLTPLIWLSWMDPSNPSGYWIFFSKWKRKSRDMKKWKKEWKGGEYWNDRYLKESPPRLHPIT